MKYTMLNTKDHKLLVKFSKERNINKSTIRAYKNSLRIFNYLIQKPLSEIIKKHKQNKNTEWINTELYDVLIKYREYLYKNYKESSANKSNTHILTILRHNNITIYDLPYWNKKQNNKSEPITYEDLPTTTELKEAYNISKPIIRAIMTFMISSGCDKDTTLKLTINDFLKATKEYHQQSTINDAIIILTDINDVIPIWRLRRGKTNKYYTTFNSPEATTNILNYLKSLNKIPYPTDKLFQIHPKTLGDEFLRLNKKLNMGKAGGYSRLRSHMLRKYHASHLKINKENEPIMTIDDIDYLQGRGKTSTRESYFFEDINHLKQKYSKVVYRVTLFTPETDVKESKSYKEIEEANKLLKEELKQKEEKIETLTLQVNDINKDVERLGSIIFDLIQKKE